MTKKEFVFSIILFIIVILIGAVLVCGSSHADWNYSFFDTVYNFDYAFVKLPNGECIEGTVKAWKDWEDSDILQVTFTDGVTYYTHSSNIVLVQTNGK